MNIEFHGTVNGDRTFITKSLSQLKALASKYCNKDYRPIDELRVTVHDIDRCENIDIMYFHRINKVCPNNTIERGRWK